MHTFDTATELDIKTTAPSDMVLLSGLFEYISLGVKPLIPLPLIACTCGRLMERKDVSQEPKSTTLEPRNLGVDLEDMQRPSASSKNFERRTLSLGMDVDL